MTGIPSIVAGLFAYALFEIFLGPGIRLGVMGSVALSVLMIPIVIRSAEEVLKIVPNHLREAAYALGTPKWKTITKIVLPTAFAGLVTGVMIAIARIIGETAPLLVTTGVVDSINTEPLPGPDAEPRRLRLQRVPDAGRDKQASYDRAWAAALTLIADRDDPQRRRPARLPAVQDRDPLSQWREGRLRSMLGADGAQAHRGRGAARARSTEARPVAATSTEPAAAGRARREDDRGPRRQPLLRRLPRGRRTSTMTIEPNKVTALIGSSGCGKTTFLRSLNRMHELTPGARVEGEITLDGEDIYAHGDRPGRRCGGWSGWSSRQPNPFPTMSIYENVAAGLNLNSSAGEEVREGRGGRALRCAAPTSGTRSRTGSTSPGVGPLRRPAAAALHRPGDRGRARGPADGRALLGARPGRDAGDRGPDRAS